MKKIRQKLLAWYGINKRDLPWRNTRNPYSIWISEVMLQQTRVDTVIPYYERFLKTFPTIQTLAQAPEEKVLKAWEGLGYYSRARNLHASAKEVSENYAGTLPNTAAELQNLKGFGPYTSAAVASIAFGEPVACVDGNVKRVVSRLFATHENLNELAQKLMEPKDPCSFNQAMMELGALICIPNNPRCLNCPVRIECKALKNDQIRDYPARKVKKAPKDLYSVAVVAQNEGKVLIHRRTSAGRFGGLWEFPTFEYEKAESPIEVAVIAMKKKYSASIQKTKVLGSFRHFLTHRTIHMTTIQATLLTNAKSKKKTWLSIHELKALPFSKLQLRVAELANL